MEETKRGAHHRIKGLLHPDSQHSRVDARLREKARDWRERERERIESRSVVRRTFKNPWSLDLRTRKMRGTNTIPLVREQLKLRWVGDHRKARESVWYEEVKEGRGERATISGCVRATGGWGKRDEAVLLPDPTRVGRLRPVDTYQAEGVGCCFCYRLRTDNVDSGFLGSGSPPAWNDWEKLIANAVGPTHYLVSTVRASSCRNPLHCMWRVKILYCPHSLQNSILFPPRPHVVCRLFKGPFLS